MEEMEVELILKKDCFDLLQEILVDPKYRLKLSELSDQAINVHIDLCGVWCDKIDEINIEHCGRLLGIGIYDLNPKFFTSEFVDLIPSDYEWSLNDVVRFSLTLVMDLYRRRPGSLVSVGSSFSYKYDYTDEGYSYYNEVSVCIINKKIQFRYDRGVDGSSVCEDLFESMDEDGDERQSDEELEQMGTDYCEQIHESTSATIVIQDGRFVLEDLVDDSDTSNVSTINDLIKRGNRLLSDMNIDVQAEFDSALANETIVSYIKVEFPDFPYPGFYFCGMEVNVGDKVLVPGYKSNSVGTVTKIMRNLPFYNDLRKGAVLQVYITEDNN